MLRRSILAAALMAATACTAPQVADRLVKHFPADGVDDVANLSGVMFDSEVSSDGNGSVRVQARRLTNFMLYEIQDIDVEAVRLVYSAKVKTKDVIGQVYLEMEGDFFTRGEINVKDIQHSLTGTTDWTERSVEFILRRSENPVSIRLSLVINGSGTAWIDDVRLTTKPL